MSVQFNILCLICINCQYLQNCIQFDNDASVLLDFHWKLEITCNDGKPDGMLRVERRRYRSAPDVSRGVSDRRTDT